jgi:hypothetical protein
MKITEEWRIFDPNDIRTHPEGDATRVEMEYEGGRKLKGIYSRAAGMFSSIGSPPNDTAIRWRYLNETTENS